MVCLRLVHVCDKNKSIKAVRKLPLRPFGMCIAWNPARGGGGTQKKLLKTNENQYVTYYRDLLSAEIITKQQRKGAKKRPALHKSAWLQFISLAGLAKHTEPRSNTVVA